MADLIRQIKDLVAMTRNLQTRVGSLENKARRKTKTPPYQTILVSAAEDIWPSEDGDCYVWWREAKPGESLKLQKIDHISLKVYNHRKTPIWAGERFHVSRDVWGDYYRVSGYTETAFFLTGDEGIPAASGQFNPQSAECERHYFNEGSGVIDPSTDPADGTPVFETVYNHTTNAVAADKLIQAKIIDGAWFIDVEPC